jgi:hypothetical protein
MKTARMTAKRWWRNPPPAKSRSGYGKTRKTVRRMEGSYDYVN